MIEDLLICLVALCICYLIRLPFILLDSFRENRAIKKVRKNCEKHHRLQNLIGVKCNCERECFHILQMRGKAGKR